MKTESDFWEDKVIVRWVNWSKRKPEHTGSVYITFNSKNKDIVSVSPDRKIIIHGHKENLVMDEQTFLEENGPIYWLEEVYPDA